MIKKGNFTSDFIIPGMFIDSREKSQNQNYDTIITNPVLGIDRRIQKILNAMLLGEYGRFYHLSDLCLYVVRFYTFKCAWLWFVGNRFKDIQVFAQTPFCHAGCSCAIMCIVHVF